MSPPSPRILTLVLAALVCLLTALVSGQAVQTTGRIDGTVKDQTGGVIPGVTVTLTSATGTKTSVSDDVGGFAFPFLIPGAYTLKAELESFKTFEQKDIAVRLGVTTTIHVVLQPGEIAEVVTVTGEAPMVDTTTTTIGANLTESLYLRLPMQRNFTALVSMAPGVGDSGALGANNPSIGGASGLENNYIVDGVNITNPGYGSVGSYSSVYGSLGSGVTFDFVKEVQVKQGGFEAEYGQSTGGVVNVITKSGGNAFHGGVYFYGQPAGWEARRKEPNIYRVEKHTEFMRTENFDLSADLSGYLWQDRLFFYAGFNPQWTTQRSMAPAGLGQWVNPGEGFFDRKDTIYSWSAKANYVPTDNHNIEFSTFADPSRRDIGPNRTMTSEGDDNYSALAYGSWNFIGRYNGVLTNRWFLTASLGRSYTRFEEQIAHVERPGYWDYVHYPSRQLMGGIGFFENNNGENWQFNLKTTYNFDARGEHTLDFGYMYEDVTYTAVRRYTGPMLVNPYGETYGGFFRYWYYTDPNTGENYDWNGDGQITDGDALFQQYRGNFNDPNLATATTYHSFYIQDAWKLTPRITLKAGLRYDYQQMSGAGDNSITYEFTGNWAPRFGLIYDVFGNGNTKIYGNWGRFYQKIPNDMAVRAFSSEIGVTNVWWSIAYDADGRPMADQVVNDQLPGNPAITRTGANPTEIIPETKTMYQNEFVLGFDHQLSPTLSVGARYIWREVGRMLEDCGTLTIGQYLDDDSNYTYVIANPSFTSDFVINDTGEVGSDGIPDGFADPKRSYNGLELTLEKRFSQGFQFLANYRLSKLWGNYEGLYRNDNGQDDANITSLYDFRNDAYSGYLYVPGYLNTDRRHVLNFNGSYSFTNQFTVGMGFRSTSGNPINRLNAHPAYENAGEIPILPRGSDGRNEWINTIDFHMSYPIRFGDAARLRLALDMFNVANFKRVLAVNEDYEDAPGVMNPDFLTPGSANNPDTPLTAFQRPFNLRFSLRFEF